MGQSQKVCHKHNGIPEREEKEGADAILEIIVTEHFPTLMADKKTTV